jgi:hypothetical protein
VVVPVPRAKEPEVRKENRTGNHLDSLAHHKVIGEARRCGHYQTQLSALPGKVCDLLARSDFLLEQIDVNVPVRTRIYAGAVMERSKALEFVNIILVEPFSASVSRTRLLVLALLCLMEKARGLAPAPSSQTPPRLAVRARSESFPASILKLNGMVREELPQTLCAVGWIALRIPELRN